MQHRQSLSPIQQQYVHRQRFDLTVAAVTAGSTAGLTYHDWTDALATTPYATPAAATAGTYYIKGTDAVTGCYAIQPVTSNRSMQHRQSLSPNSSSSMFTGNG